MALLQSCFCCGLGIASGFLAVYLVIAYMVAFGFELLWILESDTILPTAAMLLCAGYFVFGLFSALLIHGIATKNTACMLLWMFAVIIMIFPEAGMVIFMSIHYWRVDSLYGLTELTCWFARIISNVIELVLVQSLYSIWKDEELVNKRLRDMQVNVGPLQQASSLNLSNIGTAAYHNNGFDCSLERLGNGIKRSMSNPHIWNGNVLNNGFMFQYGISESEFNASTFDPSQLNYSEKQSSVKKAQSLIDFPLGDDIPIKESIKQQWQPWMSSTLETNSVILPSHNGTFNTYNPRMLSKFNMSVEMLKKCASMDALNDINRNHHVIRHNTGFYAQPLPDYDVPIYYGPLDGPDFLIYKKKMDKLTSKNSLSNTSTDDVQKYRDVAL